MSGYTGPVKRTPSEEFLAAAEALADARVRYAQSFMLWRGRGGKDMTDGHAHQAAIESTRSEITVLEAELEVARMKMMASRG